MSATPAKVYVIGQRGSGLVKIGRTSDLARRLATIQTACPMKVQVLWHTDGGPALERGLHHEFRALRTYGEWFDFGEREPVTLIREAAQRLQFQPSPQQAEMQILSATYKRAKKRYEDVQKRLVKRIPAWSEGGIKQHEIVSATDLTREYIRQVVIKAAEPPSLDDIQRELDALGGG